MPKIMNNRKGLKIGQHVCCENIHMPAHILTSGTVTRFYGLIGGEEGVQIDNHSLPISNLKSIKVFKTRELMLKHHEGIYTSTFKPQARPTSKWLVFKRETSAAARHTTAMYSVTNKDNGAVLGVIKWYGPFWQYSFIPSANCIFERTCLRDIANFCEWLTAEHNAGNKKPD